MTIQILGGFIIYRLFGGTDTASATTIVGLGGAIGFGLSGFLGVLAHDHKWISIIWIPIALLLAVANRNLPADELLLREVHFKRHQFSVVVIFSLLFLSRSTPLLIVLTALFGVLAVVTKGIGNWQKRAALVAALSLPLAVGCRTVINSLSPNNPMLFPLFSGTDDFIFSEQMANSLVSWGINENTAAIGQPVRYHWLSLGWTGQTSWVSGVDTWIMTLHGMPIFGSIVVACLLLSISHKVLKGDVLCLLAPLALLVISSPFTTLDFLPVLNTTNFVPYIWVFALLLIFLENLESTSRANLVLVFLLSSFLFLGKAPYATVTAIGIGVSWMLSVMVRDQAWRKVTAFTAVSAIAMLATYLLFVRGETYGSAFTFSLQSLRNLFPFPLESGHPSIIGLILSLLAIFALVSTHVLSSIVVIRNTTTHRPFAFLLLGASLAGLLSFLLNGTGSTTYFISSSLAIASLSVPIALQSLITSGTRELQHIGILGSSLGIFLASLNGIIRHQDWLDSGKLTTNLGLIVQFIVAAGIAVLIRFVGSRRLLPVQNGLLGTLVVSALLVSFNFSQFETAIRQLAGKATVNDFNAPSSDIEAARWLRENSKNSEIFASNRYLCPESLVCPNGDPNSGSSHLISAISERRSLIEGPRFLVSTPFVTSNLYPSWVQDRVSTTLNFIDQPSSQSSRRLMESGVNWVFVQKKSTSTRNWEPWAKVAFENADVLILRLETS
ncbi:MAG: hypothetical protein EBX92_04785 [Actinobacteria bacterium]|nr:hypothetical protein [Actinomycetota bacterium]